MKVLFVIQAAFNPRDGGVQHTTYKLGKYFYENGLEVNYFSLSTKGHIESKYGTLYTAKEIDNVKSSKNIEYLMTILETLNPNIVINQHPYEADIREAIFKLRNKVNYKIVGCLRNSLFSFKDNLSFIIGEKLDGIPLKMVNNYIGQNVVLAYHLLKHRRDLRCILDKNDFFVLLAPPNQKDLEYFVGNYKSDKVIAIPNSIPKVFEYKQSEKENILLYVGRLDIKQKRADLLVPLWQLLHEKLPDWRFVIVGDGPFKDELDQQIEDKKLPSIETVGCQNPDNYYNKSSVLVMPSAFEGFPNVLIEAQSHSVVPILFDSYSSVSWVVEDKKNALLVKPFHVSKMAKKIITLTKKPNLLKKMSLASSDNARRFTTDKIGEEWINFFEELILNDKEK